MIAQRLKPKFTLLVPCIGLSIAGFSVWAASGFDSRVVWVLLGFVGVGATALFFAVYRLFKRSMLDAMEVDEDLLVKSRAIESGSSEVYVIDPRTLCVMSANETGLLNLGYTLEQVKGHTVAEFAPSILETDTLTTMTQSLQSTGKLSHCYDHVRSDGSTYPFEFKAMLVQGRLKTVLVVFGNDVSASRAQQDALLRSEERMQLALQGSNDGLFDFDVKAQQLFVSDLVREWLNLAENVFPLHTLREYIDEDCRSRVEEAFRNSVAHGNDLNVEFQVHSSKGVARWIQARGQMHSESGQAVRLSGFLSDVTSRKVAENLLYATVSRLGAVLDNIADGILTLAEDGSVCTVNPAAAEMFGMAKDALAGTKLNERMKLYDAEGDDQVIDWAAVSDGQLRETLAVFGDGSTFAAEITVTRMDGVGDERYTVVARDIDERKEHELELRGAMEEAQAATQAKGDFLATMSHEIRTPMNGVLGMTQLLLDMGLNAQQRETAETIFSSGEALLTLINDILDFSKIEAGKLELENLPFDLRRAVKEVMDLVSSHARRKSLDLYVDYPEQLPFAFEGDVGRIRQVLLNLVGNAVKFTSAGHVLVKVDLLTSDYSAPCLRVAVRDTGPGIDADTQSRLFESFTQADASTTRQFGGTGLGLAISKQLVELMGGEIGIRSAGGEGAEFWFTLQLAASDMAQAMTPGHHDQLRGLRLLTVDDNEVGLHISRRMAASFGMQVAATADPTQVTKLLREAHAAGTPFDVAVLDYNMPVLDGLSVAELIRAEPALAGVKVVMLTSSDLANTGKLDGFALKPIMRDGFARLLTLALFEQSVAAEQMLVQDVDDVDKAETLNGVRVLVAEDNPVNQRVAVRMLEKLGCRVDVAANGREAVQMWEQFSYSMIFMDCQMPELDGLSATVEIRGLEAERKRARTPIVAMTANAMARDQEDCLAAGMDDYASKPVKLSLLHTMVARWSSDQARGMYSAPSRG